MKALAWVNAKSVAEVVAREPGSLVKAGGIDVMDLLKERLVAPERLINLRTVPGLDGVRDDGGVLRVGPLVTLARVAADPLVRGRYRALADACAQAATPQIRNAATLGGNLLQRPRCWYFRSDEFPCRKKGGTTCFAQHGENQYHAIFENFSCAAVHASSAASALIAFGASITLVGPAGTRTVALDSFFTKPEAGIDHENALGPGEVLTEIALPAPAAGVGSAYVKLAEKESFDWPLVEVAAAIERSGGACARATIVLGAVAHTPRRALAVEAVLVGKTIDEATARKAAALATQGATPLGENAYKVRLLEVAVRRAILAAVDDGSAR